MTEMEYKVINCLGDRNVVDALNEMTAEVPPWELHSVVPSGLKQMEHPLHPGKVTTIMTFLVIFHRPYNPERVEA